MSEVAPSSEAVKRVPVPRMHPIVDIYPCPKLVEVFTDVVVHAALVIAALTVLFQQKLSKLEDAALSGEFNAIMGKVADTAASYTVAQLTPCEQKMVAYVTTTASAMQKDDTDDHNADLRAGNYIGVGSLTTVVVLMVIAIAAINLRYRHCRAMEGTSCHTDEIDWSHIVTNNAISFAIVGSFEVYFVMNVAAHYISTSEKDVKAAIFDRLDEDLAIVASTTDSFVAPPPKDAHENGRGILLSFAMPLVVGGFCVYTLSRLRRNAERHREVQRATSVNRGDMRGWLYDAVSWIWSGEVARIGASESRAAYAMEVCSDRVILPTIGACGMIAGITFTFFDKIARTEQLLNDRQAQRVVDQAMFTLNAALTNVSPQDRAPHLNTIRQRLKTLRAAQGKDTAATKRIRENNEDVMDKTKNLALFVGLSCVGLVVVGSVLVYLKTRTRTQTLKYMGTSAATFTLGCTVAFFCEYAFVNAVIANYDGVRPAEIVKFTIDTYNKRMQTDECDSTTDRLKRAV